MDEYGAMVEWYWQGKTEVLGEKHYTAWVGDEWVWSNGGMILAGENWSTGRKTLYSVGGRWMSMEQWWNDTDRGKLKYWEKNIMQRGWEMDEYGAMVEWYWQGKTEVLGEKHYIAWVVDGWMSMEQWWNDTERGKLKCWEKNIIQCGW